MQAREQKNRKIEVLGRLLTQEISKNALTTLSDECLASIIDLSESGTPFSYSLYIQNEDQNGESKWKHLSFQINPEMKLSLFSNKDMDTFQWFTKTNVYFLEILIDDTNEINKNNFWKALEQCLCSMTKKISIERAAKGTCEANE